MVVLASPGPHHHPINYSILMGEGGRGQSELLLQTLELVDDMMIGAPTLTHQKQIIGRSSSSNKDYHHHPRPF